MPLSFFDFDGFAGHEAISEQLAELKRYAPVVPSGHLKSENWQQCGEMARHHAAEHTDPDTNQALLELAESYDLLARRDAQSKKDPR
jgi:hypothetical protein